MLAAALLDLLDCLILCPAGLYTRRAFPMAPYPSPPQNSTPTTPAMQARLLNHHPTPVANIRWMRTRTEA